jgi:nucleoside-diphosphate-sugar epimerase
MTNSGSSPSVLVLGANGRFGREAAGAFAAAGWRVIAQSRAPGVRPASESTTSLVCDALDVPRVLEAARGVDVIVNALNPNYAKWDSLLPPLAKATVEVAEKSGALLMLPGNVYNFGRSLPAELREDTPFAPDTAKAGQRIALEQAMADAAARGVKSVVIRAGDFMGGKGTWLDLAFTRALRSGVVTHPGPDNLAHAWAYVPDLARVFVKVAERRAELEGFASLHYEGLTLTGRQIHQALEAVTGRTLKPKPMPWWQLKAAGLVSPMMRAVLEMRYLWERPHRLVEFRLPQLIGAVPATPIVEVLKSELR